MSDYFWQDVGLSGLILPPPPRPSLSVLGRSQPGSAGLQSRWSDVSGPGDGSRCEGGPSLTRARRKDP